MLLRRGITVCITIMSQEKAWIDESHTNSISLMT